GIAQRAHHRRRRQPRRRAGARERGDRRHDAGARRAAAVARDQQRRGDGVAGRARRGARGTRSAGGAAGRRGSGGLGAGPRYRRRPGADAAGGDRGGGRRRPARAVDARYGAALRADGRPVAAVPARARARAGARSPAGRRRFPRGDRTARESAAQHRARPGAASACAPASRSRRRPSGAPGVRRLRIRLAQRRSAPLAARRRRPRSGRAGVDRAGSMTAPDVLLVSMPFGPLLSPSLGLSLLRPQVCARGLSCGVEYFTLAFAEQIGERLYSRICSESRAMSRAFVGEWIFSHALFDWSRDHDDRYLREVLLTTPAWLGRNATRPPGRADLAAIRAARDAAPAFVDACADRVAALRPRIVGFTSVFQQHLASLALAKRLKARLPDVVVVMGGANCEATMGVETVKQFPFVDAVVS